MCLRALLCRLKKIPGKLAHGRSSIRVISEIIPLFQSLATPWSPGHNLELCVMWNNGMSYELLYLVQLSTIIKDSSCRSWIKQDFSTSLGILD